MNLTELKELLELIAERDITEFELEEEGVKLRIKKGAAGVSISGMPAATARELQAVASAGVGIASDPEPDGDALDDLDGGLSLVTSPMVGTFFRQAEPGAEPFAQKGDPIKKGQVLCIIEAMKLMNEIESELHGELVEIYVENGQAVQFGDKLFAIRES